MIRRNGFAILAIILALISMISASHAGEAHKKAKIQRHPSSEDLKLATRKPSSLPVTAGNPGQAEQMLMNTTSSSPSFLKGRNEANNKVRISGVCRDGYGVRHYSDEKTYGECMDARSHSGSSVNDLSGPAQRQAGVGVLVGN